MLTPIQNEELIALVKLNLDRAEATWNKVGKEFAMYEALTVIAKRAETVPSNIPGHDWVSEDNPIVDGFVALVADMRGSSQHLLCEISEKKAKVSMLQRVYYETSALLPALAQTIRYQEGRVTEYLGDGVLALFLIEKDKEEKSLYASYNAAQDCIADARKIVNLELNSRYNLPDLDIGVGLSTSKAIITLVGLDGEKHPKAIGECVYRATKLSGGINQIFVDERLRVKWPTAEGGTLHFSSTKAFGEVKGYLVSRKP